MSQTVDPCLFVNKYILVPGRSFSHNKRSKGHDIIIVTLILANHLGEASGWSRLTIFVHVCLARTNMFSAHCFLQQHPFRPTYLLDLWLIQRELRVTRSLSTPFGTFFWGNPCMSVAWLVFYITYNYYYCRTWHNYYNNTTVLFCIVFSRSFEAAVSSIFQTSKNLIAKT